MVCVDNVTNILNYLKCLVEGCHSEPKLSIFSAFFHK